MTQHGSGERQTRLGHRLRALTATFLAGLTMSTFGVLTFGSAPATAAYQGVFCNSVFLWSTDVCSSGNFGYSRRVTGNSYGSWTWVSLWGTNCGSGNFCTSNVCQYSGCTADTGYWGSYGSGCGWSCNAEIQNYAGSVGDWFFGHIYA